MNRSDTTKQTISHLNPAGGSVSFDFSQANNNVRVIIPQESGWSMPLHWHSGDTDGCTKISCADGNLHIYTARRHGGSQDRLGSGGSEQRFDANQLIAWGRNDKVNKRKLRPLIIYLEVSSTKLLRNICSVELDRNLFPRSASTPLWLRVLFKLLAWSSTQRARERLLDGLMWIQLRMMFHKYDFHLYCGRVFISWWWTAQPFGGTVPEWAREFEWRSQEVITGIVQGGCYCIGRLLLGMRAEYRQYTP